MMVTSSRLGMDEVLLSSLGHEGSLEVEGETGGALYSSRFLLLRIFSGDGSMSE